MSKALLLPLLALAAASCGHTHHDPAPVASPRPVSILVEVYDPITNFVWENVAVQVLEADQEWSGCTCVSPYQDLYYTDVEGRVFLDEFALALAEVGFAEDGAGRAMLWPGRYEDEATVVLEVSAPGFVPVIVEVPLRWDQPDVFVEVPFN